MTQTEIIQSLDNCIEIAKNSENKYIENRLTEIANSLMNDSVKHAKQTLKDAGYFVDNLWHVNDVQDNFECDEETAQNILYWSMTSPAVIEYINETINRVATNEQLNTK
jgi:hypothetical protein